MDYVPDTTARLAANRRCIPGLRLVHEASVLRHFLSTLEPVG